MNRIGPTGRVIAANLARIRRQRGLTTQQLADGMEFRGFAITASAITKTELAQRKVEAEELLVFALVLGVNPSALYGPPDQDGAVEVTGLKRALPASEFWDWLDGLRPLLRPETDDGSARADFQLHARPEGRRKFDV